MTLGKVIAVCAFALLVLAYTTDADSSSSGSGSGHRRRCRHGSRSGSSSGSGSHSGHRCYRHRQPARIMPQRIPAYRPPPQPAYRPPPQPAYRPPPPPVNHPPKSGVTNNIRWLTSWNNGVCTLTCYYIVIENGNFVLRSMKKYNVPGDDPYVINGYLFNFQNSVPYPTSTPPQNGPYYTFSIKQKGGLTVLLLDFAFYVDGRPSVLRSHEYTLNAGWDFSDFSSCITQFKVITQAASSASYHTANPNYTHVSVKWEIQPAGNGQQKIVLTYVETENGRQTFTKTKEYVLQGTTLDEKLKMRDNFKNEMLSLRGFPKQ